MENDVVVQEGVKGYMRGMCRCPKCGNRHVQKLDTKLSVKLRGGK